MPGVRPNDYVAIAADIHYAVGTAKFGDGRSENLRDRSRDKDRLPHDNVCIYGHLIKKNQCRCALERLSNNELTPRRLLPFSLAITSACALSHSGIAEEKAFWPLSVACTCF